MTREELKEHCLKQIEMCEMWARCKDEEPHGKVYEEHKLILELLEQETVSKESYDHEYFLRKKMEAEIDHLRGKTDMIDKSNFSQEQYKADLQSAYDCGFEAGKKAEQEPRWIPVSEKLPNDRNWYLGIFKEPDTGWINPLPFICDYVGRETKATTKEYWILRGFTDWDDYHIDYYFNLECVAWMPLPKSYGEIEV